jgi:acetyl-CoA C-acetyltransferase
MTKASILGTAALPVRRHLEQSVRDAATQVALDAIVDAGLGPRDIDGLFVSPPGLSGPPGFMFSCIFAHHLGLHTKAQALVECGGMTATLALKMAVDAVQRGECRAALALGVDDRVIDPRSDLEHFIKNAVTGLVGLYGSYDSLYGLAAPIPYYAMSAQRYLHEYGASERDLAEVAVTLRRFASRHPRAEHQKPITVDDVMNSRTICPPLKLLDCSSFSSGAAAVVVTRDDIAPRDGVRRVTVAAIAEDHEPAHFASVRGPLTRFGSAERAAHCAYQVAGRSPADIDVAEIYGVFSATELMLYEDLGFFDKGKAVAAVRDGKTSGEGRTLFNPSGGRLSMGHPAGATPLLATVEAVEQLRGQAVGHQVPSADLALVHAEHGMLNGSFVGILEGA